jgi:hypothetical protein
LFDCILPIYFMILYDTTGMSNIKSSLYNCVRSLQDSRIFVDRTQQLSFSSIYSRASFFENIVLSTNSELVFYVY